MTDPAAAPAMETMNEGSTDRPQTARPDGIESNTSQTSLEPNTRLLKEYLLKHAPVFNELMELKQKASSPQPPHRTSNYCSVVIDHHKQGWENSKGDDHFKKRRSRADNADLSLKRILYNMMCEIGDELHLKTSVLRISPPPGQLKPKVLDLCMAPGGFATSVMKYNPRVKICGISLPREQGGHEMLMPRWGKNPDIDVRFLDITMLAGEMGVNSNEVPADHPDASNFIFHDRPFHAEMFELVTCDGQVLRTHTRANYRERYEAVRLTVSQLILALQRVRENGTILMLLHKVDAWPMAKLLHVLSGFAELQLFKSAKKHAIRSSFYVIARQVQPHSVAALKAVESWKEDWRRATFMSEEEYWETDPYRQPGVEHDVRNLLEEFGERLVELGSPIWEIQRAALSRASFMSG